MVDKEPPRPRKHPQQRRSLLLVNALRKACLKILQEEGPDQLTTQRIADVAEVNIASVYQYFPNKEAVLAGVYEEVAQQQANATFQSNLEIDVLSRQSLEKTLAAIIDLEVKQLLALYKLYPAFCDEFYRSFDIHEKVDQITQTEQNPSWDDWFTRFLARHKSQLREADINTLSVIVLNTLQGNLQSTARLESELLECSKFRVELMYLLLAYLLPEPRTLDECRTYFD